VRTNVQACERIISFNFPIDDPPISVISNSFPLGVNLTFPPSRLQPPRRPEACAHRASGMCGVSRVSAMAAVWRHRPTAPSAREWRLESEIDRDGARPHASPRSTMMRAPRFPDIPSIGPKAGHDRSSCLCVTV